MPVQLSKVGGEERIAINDENKRVESRLLNQKSGWLDS